MPANMPPLRTARHRRQERAIYPGEESIAGRGSSPEESTPPAPPTRARRNACPARHVPFRIDRNSPWGESMKRVMVTAGLALAVSAAAIYAAPTSAHGCHADWQLSTREGWHNHGK